MKSKRQTATYLQKRAIDDLIRANMIKGEDGYYDYINNMSDHNIATMLGDGITSKMVQNIRHTIKYKMKQVAKNYPPKHDDERIVELESAVQRLTEENIEIRQRIDNIVMNLRKRWSDLV